MESEKLLPSAEVRNNRTEFVSRVLNWLKDYLGVVVVAPAVVGGLWQAIELMLISPACLRFFSVTQIIPDGLLVLFLFAAAFGIFGIILHLTIKFNRWNQESTTDSETNQADQSISFSDTSYRNAFWVLFLSAFLSLGLLSTMETPRTSLFIILFIFLQIFVCALTLIFLRLALELTNVYDWWAFIYKVFFYSTIIVVMFNILGRFHSAFIVPENISNFKSFQKVYFKSESSSYNYSLLYYNDEYLFVKLNEKIKGVVFTEIKILPFDELLIPSRDSIRTTIIHQE